MAASDVTARAASPDRRPPALDRVRWTLVLRTALGALFVSVFLENLVKGLYTPRGYAGLINGYANDPHATAPGFWRHDVMPFIAGHASFFAPAQAAFELALGVALVLGLATGLVALLAAGHLTILWFSELGIFWVWELLGLIIVAAVVGLSTLPQLAGRGRGLADRLLGPPLFGGMPMPGRLAVAVAAGAALTAALLLSRTGGSARYLTLAPISGVAVALLIGGLALLDRRRAAPGP
jgi:DoxX